MKIIVEKVVNGEKVLVPEVFLASVRAENLTNDGALIVGGDVAIYSKENIENIGTIRADGTVELKGENINNLGGRIDGENVNLDADKNITNKGGNIRARVDTILNGENVINEANVKESQYKGLDQKTVGNAGSIRTGQNLSINVEKDIVNKGSVLVADNNLDLNAGRNVDIVTVANEKHVGVVCPGSSAEIHSVENQQSVMTGGNVNINAGSDVNIQGGLIAADKDTAVKAGGNVNINAVKDSYSEETRVGSRGGSYYNHNKQVDEAVKGTTIAAKNDISIASGKDINIKGSNVASEAGKADLIAENNINITNATEYHERLHEEHNKVSGLLSSKTTDIYDYSKQNTVVGSNVSAGEIAISSKKDTNVTGSNVVADNDVSVKTGGSMNIGSAEQTSESEYRKSVKKSGVFAGGGLGFTIGKEKQKDQYANQNTEQVGSTVGSVKGNVNLDADKAANVKGSTVVAGKDINITGENVKIENSDSIYNAQEKHEFKRTGLSVSVGGAYVDVVNNAANSVKHATDVEDKRLGALVAVKGYKDADKAIKNIKGNGSGKVNENLSINVSLGTTKSKSESKSTTTVANASEVKAGGDINVTSTKKDIDITGSNVEGKDVTLNAKENLNITASKNTNKTEQNSKSSSASVGASLELGKGPSYSISGSMSKGEMSANGTTYNESNVTANRDLSFVSGNDTNIKGGKLSGEKVTGNVGNDLNIESKQDSNSYKEKNKSVGASIGLGSNKAISGSASVGKIDSNYKSVTDQSGIYVGKEGFDINVGENTDLKGGIISSAAEADKNKLSTGTLTFEDIQNKADYKADNNGISASEVDGTYKYSPSKGMTASGKAESTTKATVSEGTIEICDKENHKQDINKLNRDTANSLNKLGEIFDKTDVKERMELADEFGKLAYEAVGDLAQAKGWKEGSKEKNALHAVVGGIMSKLGGNGFLAGASAGLINEMVQKELSEMFKDPGMHELASALLGEVVSKLVGGNAGVGASVANSATKNNYLTHEQQKKYEEELAAIDKDDMLTPEQKAKAKEKVDFKYSVISVLQNREWYEKNKDKLQLTGKVGDLNEYEIFKEVVGVDKSGNDVELRADTKDWMIGYSRDLVEAVANIKPGDRIKFSDGSIYYVQPNGELYKEDSIGALMPYKEISLENHNVTSKREFLLGKDTVISDDHHEKAGQYVYDFVDNIMESYTGAMTIVSAFSNNNNNIILAAELCAGVILLIHGSNESSSTFSNINHDLVDNEKMEYNVLKDLLGNDRYDNFDSVAKVISLYGDLDKLVLASKTGRFNNINWEHLVGDDVEREKLKSTLEDLGLVMDIKTVNDLRGKDAEDK